MDKAEYRRVTRQLDRLDDRVRRVIALNKPLKLDQSARPERKPLAKVKRPEHDYSPVIPVIASGQLTGHEMRLPEYEPPGCSQDEHRGFDFMRDVIFAEFK